MKVYWSNCGVFNNFQKITRNEKYSEKLIKKFPERQEFPEDNDSKVSKFFMLPEI